jgi:hypothetical protein
MDDPVDKQLSDLLAQVESDNTIEVRLYPFQIIQALEAGIHIEDQIPYAIAPDKAPLAAKLAQHRAYLLDILHNPPKKKAPAKRAPAKKKTTRKTTPKDK